MFMDIRTDDILKSALNMVEVDSKLKALIEEERESMIAGDTGELFAIFYGSSMIATDEIHEPNEKEILHLLVNYLSLKIANIEETDKTGRIFSFTNEQRNKMKTIFEILKQWLVDVIIVNAIKKSSAQIQVLKNYAVTLQKRVHNLQDLCILPSGFAKTAWNSSNFENFLMLETKYNGPYSAASVIEVKSTVSKNFTQIDPISPYQRSFRELTSDKISLGLEIKNIPSTNLDVDFFLHLMTLRTIAPGDENYEFAYLYEVILPKLAGEANFRTESEFFVNMEEKGFFSIPWTLVRNVFYYLLKKFFDSAEAQSLYLKIICEFQFRLLISSFDKYKTLETSDRLNHVKYQFLLHEMCNKVAFDAVNYLRKKKRMISDYIMLVHQTIDSNNKNLYKEKRNEKTSPKMTFTHKNFQEFLPDHLKGLQFIQENITGNLAFSLSSTLRKQLPFAMPNTTMVLIDLSRMLDELTEHYGLNRVIQISLLIENFVISIAQHSDFRKWHNDEKTNVNSARILVQIANLYYNCSAIIASELHPDKNCLYDPTQYTKLVLVMFGILAMMDNLVRNDNIIGSSFTKYVVSTESKNISLESIIRQLALPEKKWLYLLNKIKTYFNISVSSAEQRTASEKCLFHYSSLSLENNSNENNIDVIYMLKVLKKNFIDSYKRFEASLKHIEADQWKKGWTELLFTNKFLPELLQYIRDISYLSQLSLHGFSIETINKVKFSLSKSDNKYSCFKCSYNPLPEITHLGIKIDFAKDKRRFVDFTLPGEKNPYQHLISCNSDRENGDYMTENTIIVKQSDKPDNLTRPQYYRLCSMPLFENLKLTLLYIALKHEEINFEIEEHCFLVKQILHKVGVYNNIHLLEKQFQNEKFTIPLVNKFVEIILDLKERMTQYKSMGHALDILTYLYDFCSDNTRNLIDECLAKFRSTILKYIDGKNHGLDIMHKQDVTSILSCYYILTYKNLTALNEKEVLQLVRLRILIDNNFKLHGSVPTNWYVKAMINLFYLSSTIESIIDNNLSMLDAYIESSTGFWKKDTNMNFYVKDCYSLLPLKGRIYKSGHPLLCLPSQVFNNSDYKECFGTQNFLVEITNKKVWGQTLRCYETKSKESENIRISCLANDQIWIEDKTLTFVSRKFLEKLPRFLLENTTHIDNESIAYYNHWYENDKILVRDKDEKMKFEIDLGNNEIYSTQHQKFLIPFVKDGFDQSNVLYTIFSRFEDENYILALKNNEEDKEPVMIYLPRLNLKFKIEGTKVISEDFKDYCLSQDPHIDTLFGLSHYLVIEPHIQSDNPIRFNRKIIIPYHPIQKTESFFSSTVQFNLNKVGRPAYFAYEIDENLEYLNSETTAGSLYLALLYFKTATLDKDFFVKMNGYETCAEILKTCWQNCAYTDIEFSIILQFFENKCPDIQKPWSNYVDKEKEIFDIASYGPYPHHRNTHAIFLRLIYLLSSSYQTYFLVKADVSKKKLHDYFVYQGFLKYHFNFYLLFKARISKRCRLSLEEEKQLLFACVDSCENDYSNSRILDYYKSIKQNKELELTSSDPIDYKRLEISFLSKASYKEPNFEIKIREFFPNKDRDFYYVHCNKNCDINNLFSTWVKVKFEVPYFISLYKIALDIGNTTDFNNKTFLYFLTYLFLKASDTDKSFIKMLYIVSHSPKEFEYLPAFLLSSSNQINCDQRYLLDCFSRKLSESDIPSISYHNGDTNKEIKSIIWPVLKKEYLNDAQESKFSVKEIAEPSFKQKFENTFAVVLEKTKFYSDCKHFPNNLYEKFLSKSRNKELYRFFIDVSNRCDRIINLTPNTIGYTIADTTGLSDFKMSLSMADIEKQINPSYVYSKITENCTTDLEWKMKTIDMNDYYEKMQQHFDFKSYFPKGIPFPLDLTSLPEGSPAREAFSEGYGKTFISDLEDSYGRSSPNSVKMNGKYFFIAIQEPKKGIDVLRELGCNYDIEFDSLENRLSEIKDDLLLEVEQWISCENSKKYISENEREQIINMRTEFDVKCRTINDELIIRNIQTQPIATEPLKQLLQRFTTDPKLKRTAKNWLKDLYDIETKIEDFLMENDNLFKLYLNYNRKQRIISPSILKLICKNSDIGISVYDKLDTPGFELKIIENYSYISDECKKQLKIWLKDGMFCHVETKEIEDDNKILGKLRGKSNVDGYLQTRIETRQLKAKHDINDISHVLNERYFECQKLNMKLLKEIRRNLTLLPTKSDEVDMLVLHRIIGENVVPTKKELLSLLKNIEKINEFNPFVGDEESKFHAKIEHYLVQVTLIQQITRVISLISQYKRLNPENSDERERLMENILTNISMKRVYDKKEYPSWLLFETENNLLIRETQYFFIQEMMKDENNNIYQLNMGEGKTSVILVILSEMLANGKRILRINCLEPLMGVMQELLRNKFRGLLQKKIYLMPFSRGVIFSIENLRKIKEMLTECQNGKHILLVTPEQRLCFQLKKQEMFLEYLQSKDADDCFNWQQHKEYSSHNRQKYTNQSGTTNTYVLTQQQHTLKAVLVSLGYIDNKDKILKFPSDEFDKFSKEIHDKIDQEGFYNIFDAYEVLRARSKQLKTERQKKLDLLYLIDEFNFFDILDESDEILRHGKELNYSLGLPKPLDGGSVRWEIPFLLFKIIFTDTKFYEILIDATKQDDCPVVFQEHFTPISGIGGGSPLVRFVRHEYFVKHIRPELSRKICTIILARFPQKTTNITDSEGENFGTYEDFIEGKCSPNEDKIVTLLKAKSQDMLNSFLLAKAWVSHELLYHVMSYRYRVEYGLPERREKEIAIPFRGKDLPSENSEFSHPDIMIGFTILSYLYRGLDLEQVKYGLIKLKSDPKQDRDSLLKQWVAENKKWIDEQIQKEHEQFPTWLESFKTLDLEDENTVKKVHIYLSRNFNFIQYYLSNFTFPNETKYYDKKLTGNAHTLAGEGKTRGFSGTDDRNDTMPESITPKRLSSQIGTNGKMLHILSREINNNYQAKTGISSTVSFLDEVCAYTEQNKNYCILIDAGAVVTEMSNFDVSKYFIRKIDKRFEGVVHFSDKTNKLMVILREGDYLPLSACHIDKKKLFVYLDEVHTRGTDLQLPITAHGLVTIGKNMNKDKLMQAVMRLRDLDQKQSIVLWGLKEVSADIAIINGIRVDDITSKHVLIWVTYNTIRKNESDLYLVTKEKLKYVIKSRALEYQKEVKEIPINSLIVAYVSEGVDSIEKSYGNTLKERNPRDILYGKMGAYLGDFYTNLKKELENKGQSIELIKKIEKNRDEYDRPKMKKILERVDDKLPNVILTINADYNCDQENEREIEEMQHAMVASVDVKVAATEDRWEFSVVCDPNLKEKGLRGDIGYPNLKELRECFQFTNIDHLKNLKWPSQILATHNFIKTIEDIDNKNKQNQSDYLKPVNMILVHRVDKDVCFIIVSMFEAHNLIDICHKSKDRTISLIHIDDVNGPTRVPAVAKKLKQEEIRSIITVIRLFNGDCRYDTEEIKVVKKCLAFVDIGAFHEDKRISEQIYNELESRHYLIKGFITRKLAAKLANEQEKILLETEAKLGLDLQERFHSLVNESLAEDSDTARELPDLIRRLIRIRGKSDQYERSALKEILDKTFE